MGRLIATASIGRRTMLQAGVGLAGLALTDLGAAGAMAQETPAKIGTYPEGASGSSVFVGVTTPLTGPYSADGKDEQLGYELAFADINAHGPTAQKWGLQGKGVLGKEVKYGIADSETKPNVAVQAQTQFIQRNKAIMITGSVSSATAIALEELVPPVIDFAVNL